MSEYEPLKTDPRSYESSEGDVLPLDLFVPEPMTADNYEYTRRPLLPEEIVGPHDHIIQKALAEQALRNATFEKTEQSETLSVPAALSLLHGRHGFYPHDNTEKNTMVAILGRSDKPSPLISYFLEIQTARRKSFNKILHNRAEEQLPKASVEDIKKERTEYEIKALRHITRDMIQYAENAAKDASFSRTLNTELGRLSSNETKTFAGSFTEADIRQNGELRRGLTSLARRAEVGRFAKGRGENPLGKNDGIDSVKDNDRTKRILEDLQTLSLEEAMQGNQALIKEEERRFDYWRSVLEQATHHNGIAAQAREALEKLDKLRPREQTVAR